MAKFIMVEVSSAYNIILGRLNRARAVVSTHSLVVKFLTPKETGILKGDQATTKSCYITSLRRGTVSEALTIEDPREEKDGMSPVEELTQVALGLGSPQSLCQHWITTKSRTPRKTDLVFATESRCFHLEPRGHARN